MTEPADGAAVALHLDLALHPDDLARFTRSPDIVRGGPARGSSGGAARRATPLAIIWHDTPDAALARDGLALAERRQGRETLWRLERIRPDAAMVWAPGTPPPLVAEAATPDALGHALPHPLMAVAGFEGQLRIIAAPAAVAVSVLTGALRAVAGERAVCRVALEGDSEAVAALAQKLAQAMRLCVPPAPLAMEAYACARPDPPQPRLGAPSLVPALPVGAAFAFAVAHLATVILHYGALIGADEDGESVHQMRVAVRRLRSIVKLFGRVVACPETEAAAAGLRALGRVLGPARDWDVFIAGTGRDVAHAFPEEAAVARLIVAARRERAGAYQVLAAFLANAEFRQLGLTLAGLAATRPWERVPPPEPAHVDPPEPADPDLRHFAAKALAKRHKRLLAPGGHIADLPAPELHAIRLDGKRLRYAAEILAPLFPGHDAKRFLKRLSTLQERLGTLNDGAVAAGLLERLGQSRSYVGGLVRGFVAAGSVEARAHIDRAWRKLRRRNSFWQ